MTPYQPSQRLTNAIDSTASKKRLDIALALENMGFSVGGWVTEDTSNRHRHIADYSGVTDRARRLQIDDPTLPKDALLLTMDQGRVVVINPASGSVCAYREPPFNGRSTSREWRTVQ